MSEANKEAIEGVKKISSNIGEAKHIEEPITVSGQADKAQFDALMEQKNPSAAAQVAAQEGDKGTSLDKLNAADPKIDPSLKNSPEEIRTSIQKTTTKIDEIKNDLNTVDVNRIKPYQKLMRNKLVHTDEQLKIAMSKMGMEFPETPVGLEAGAVEAGAEFSPMREFVGRLSHIDYQMDNLSNYLGYMSEKNKELSPGNMLAVQIKVTHIGQEVEFFAGLLSQVLKGVQALQNVQV